MKQNINDSNRRYLEIKDILNVINEIRERDQK